MGRTAASLEAGTQSWGSVFQVFTCRWTQGATAVQAPTFCALSLNWAVCKLWFFFVFHSFGRKRNYYFQVKKKNKMKVKDGDKKLTSWFKKETENLILFKLRVITSEQPPRNLWELFRSLEVKAQLPTFLRQSAVHKHSLYNPDLQVESEEWLMGHSWPLPRLKKRGLSPQEVGPLMRLERKFRKVIS